MRLQDLVPASFDRRPAVPLGLSGASVLLAYLAVVFTGVISHEPWFDEAQSWLLARDASVGELLGTYLRYEGHPPLWYLFLMLPAKLGFPYQTANVLSAIFMTLGVILMLRLPAIPLAVRCLAPFGFFIAYQFSVIARSYALIFPILMALAHLYGRRRERILTVTLLLIALSNVSLHGLAMAWAFAALYAFELLTGTARLDADERWRHLVAAALFLTSTAALLVILWPPNDLLIAGQLNATKARVLAMRVFVLSILGLFNDWWLISLVALGAYLVWFHRQRMLLTFLAPMGAVFTITCIYSNRWHEGLFFMIWLFTVLLSLRAPAPARSRMAIILLTVVVLTQHIAWAAKTLNHDIYEPYSASREAAEFIRANDLDEQNLYGAGFTSLALQPYFDQPLFDNYRTSGGFTFWDWSVRTPYFHPTPGRTLEEMRQWFDAQLADRPAMILVGLKFGKDRIYMETLEAHPDYRLVRSFEGGLYWKRMVSEIESYALFVRTR